MDNPSFYLEGIVREKDELQDFEGPLSLILMLLAKNKIEIRDISISDILEQYLDYLDKMQSMDLEIASEFVQMASHLLYIKTQTLLAGDEEVSELEVLMASLEQLKCRDIFAAVPATDIVLYTTFRNKEDLQTYAVHPLHVEVVEFIKKVAAERRVVDFES